MDTIDELLTILEIHASSDRLARVSVSPCIWLVLTGISQRWFTWTGFEADEPPLPRDSGGTTIAVDVEQAEAYRLWDREGREMICNHGRMYAAVRSDC